ncbi:MAG: PH domain-containing protein [Nitrososphaerota archaeon]
MIFFIIAFLRVKTTEYFVTSHRVYVKYDLVGRRVFEIKNEWITGVIVRQGFIPRILNYGDVIYSTLGQYAGSVVMSGVSDPMHIRTIVEDVLRRFKKRQAVQEELRILEREYMLGRVDIARYEESKKKYEEKIKAIE